MTQLTKLGYALEHPNDLLDNPEKGLSIRRATSIYSPSLHLRKTCLPSEKTQPLCMEMRHSNWVENKEWIDVPLLIGTCPLNR